MILSGRRESKISKKNLEHKQTIYTEGTWKHNTGGEKAKAVNRYLRERERRRARGKTARMTK